MQVRMLIHISGSRNGEPWPPTGGVADITEHEAETLIHHGYAERVEVATVEAPEKAARTGRPKGRKAR